MLGDKMGQKKDIADADKIILPESLQRAMMNFFRDAAALKQARDKNCQQTSPNPEEMEAD
jgi:hypothetical protein